MLYPKKYPHIAGLGKCLMLIHFGDFEGHLKTYLLEMILRYIPSWVGWCSVRTLRKKKHWHYESYHHQKKHHDDSYQAPFFCCYHGVPVMNNQPTCYHSVFIQVVCGHGDFKPSNVLEHQGPGWGHVATQWNIIIRYVGQWNRSTLNIHIWSYMYAYNCIYIYIQFIYVYVM